MPTCPALRSGLTGARAGELGRYLDHGLVDQHGDRVEGRWRSSRGRGAGLRGGWRRRRRRGRGRRAAARGRTVRPRASGPGLSAHVRRQLLRISARAFSRTRSLVVFSHSTRSSIIPKRRSRSSFCSSSVGNSSDRSEGSSTSWAKSTARAAASGRRAHHRWRVLGWPWRIDFSRAEAAFILSSGRATSISFLRVLVRSMRFSQFQVGGRVKT